MWTKREIIVDAFQEIGRAEYIYGITAEEYQGALRRLDSMMASWAAQGIDVGYLLPTDQSESSLDQASGMPDSANLTVSAGLAISIGPSYGMTVSPQTVATFNEAYNALLTQGTSIPELVKSRRLPVGAGNKWREVYRPFTQTVETLEGGTAGTINLPGEVTT